MSDSDLQRACAPKGWQMRLQKTGWLPFLFVWVVAVAAGAMFLPNSVSMAHLLAVTVGLSLTLFFLPSFLAGLGRGPFCAELRHRYGMASISAYMEEEMLVLAGEHAPMASLLLAARLLPHGGHRWIRVHVWDTLKPRVRVDVRVVKERGGALEMDTADLIRREVDLEDSRGAEILALLHKLEPAALAPLENKIIDGAPCTVMVIDGRSKQVHTGSCNLAGLTSDSRNHPTARFADAIWRAGEVVTSEKLLTSRRLRGDGRVEQGRRAITRRANVGLNEGAARRLLLGTKQCRAKRWKAPAR